MMAENTINVNTILNNSLNWKFYVLAHELDDIEAFVSKYITVKVGDTKINGKLNGVRTWAQKVQGQIVGIYKEINMTINIIDANILNLPDKKELITENISIVLDVV